MATKKYTILETDGGQVMLVKSSAIYDVAYLYTSIDHSYILDKNEVLRPTEDYYPLDYFENNDERLVVKEEDIKNDKQLVEYFKNAERIVIRDEWDEEDIVLIDASDYMCCATAKAVDIEHGINTDTIYFDIDDDCGIETWHSVEEVEADYEVEHHQDYPNQPFTRIYTCSNGKKIRETSPFFADDSIETYEYID